MHPLVSVIVTTKNEEKNIGMCLKSIKCQSYRNIEIIVVDNYSGDKTKEIAGRYTDLVYDKGDGMAAQRNYGVGVCGGEYIIYVDADMILAPFTIESCVGVFKSNPLITGLYIPEIIIGRRLWSKIRRFERSFYDATVIDAVRFIKKDVFIKAKGFDESFSPFADWDFNRKISVLGEPELLGAYAVPDYLNGAENHFETEVENFLVFNGFSREDLSNKYNNVIFHNETNMNLSGYLRKKSRYIKEDYHKYINKWGKDDIIVRKQFGLFYRYFKIFTENGKWKKLLRHPFLAIYTLSFKTAVGLIYLKFRLPGGGGHN